MRMARVILSFLLILSSSPRLGSQQSPPVTVQSDPRALSILTQASLALMGGTPVNDATLTGTAISTAGSTREAGPVTLTFAGSSFSRVDLQLDSGSSSL